MAVKTARTPGESARGERLRTGNEEESVEQVNLRTAVTFCPETKLETAAEREPGT